MGWSFCNAQHYKKNGQVDRKREVDDLYTWESNGTKVSVVKSVMVGSDYFAAIRINDEDGERVEAVMCLTAGKDRRDPWFNFGYKSIPHVDSDHCPLSIIKLLSPADDEREMEWRKRCEEYAKKPKLKDLPVGSVIYFKNWNGDEYTLTKMEPNHQFTKTWWFDAARYAYMPSCRIPDSWELIKRGEN